MADSPEIILFVTGKQGTWYFLPFSAELTEPWYLASPDLIRTEKKVFCSLFPHPFKLADKNVSGNWIRM
jgi:hypothetical protein